MQEWVKLFSQSLMMEYYTAVKRSPLYIAWMGVSSNIESKKTDKGIALMGHFRKGLQGLQEALGLIYSVTLPRMPVFNLRKFANLSPPHPSSVD